MGQQRDPAVPGDHQAQPNQPQVRALLLGLSPLGNGRLALPVSMKVAKLVMSRATELVSSPDRAHAASATFSSIRARPSRGTACIASQNRR